MIRVVRSTSAASRLAQAAEFLESRPSFSEVVVVGASRGAADDLARAVAHRLGATFGILRFSLTELAARAATQTFEARHTAGTQAASEAMAARATFAAVAADELQYFAPVARMPGFPKALARTIHELRLAGSVGRGRPLGRPIRQNLQNQSLAGCILKTIRPGSARPGRGRRRAHDDF